MTNPIRFVNVDSQRMSVSVNRWRWNLDTGPMEVNINPYNAKLSRRLLPTVEGRANYGRPSVNGYISAGGKVRDECQGLLEYDFR